MFIRLFIIILLATAAVTIAHAEVSPAAPRLALWITDSIDTDADPGEKCTLPPPSSPGAAILPASAPTLTERDVSAWNVDNATWTLNPARFTNGNNVEQLLNRCFVLAIDGKLISRGIVLSSHSARLIEFPTLSLFNQENTTSLQLASGNHGSHTELIHVDALDAVLGRHTSTTGKDRNHINTTCDESDRVIRKESATGDVTEYIYHPQTGKMIQVLNKDLKTDFVYDGQGNLTRAENSNGQVIDLEYGNTPLIQHIVEVNRAEDTRRELTFKYNKDGRPTEITLVGIGKIVVEYDDTGEISKVDSDGGSKIALQVTLAFQNLTRVVKVAGARL